MWLFHSTQHLLWHTKIIVYGVGPSNNWITGWDPVNCHQDLSVGELEKLREVEGIGFVQPREWKAWTGGECLLMVFQYLVGSYREAGGTLFTRMHGDRQDAIGKRGAFWMWETIFNVKTSKCCSYLPRKVMESSWLEILKTQLSLKLWFQTRWSPLLA